MSNPKDIAPLIELLKMAAEQWPPSMADEVATYSARIKPCLRCGRKPAGAQASGDVNFRPE